jgi:hypothetical protein
MHRRRPTLSCRAGTARHFLYLVAQAFQPVLLRPQAGATKGLTAYSGWDLVWPPFPFLFHRLQGPFRRGNLDGGHLGLSFKWDLGP